MILRAQSRRECWRENARLPYSLAVNEVRRAVDSVYRFLHSINETLARQELGLLEDLILGNTFSGLLSGVVVKSIARESRAVVRNRYIGGNPDPIPASNPKGDSQLRCEQGIEVTTSRQAGGWQGHNPETGWLMVFRYEAANQAKPTQFVQILAAKLSLRDWSLAERGAQSRRTRTCSINREGVAKLRANPVYEEPEWVVRKRG